MSHKTEDGLFLLGGALLGAAAMYMLDPESGERRRQRAAKTAEGAWKSTAHHVTDGWEIVRDQAGDLAAHLRDHAHDLASSGAAIGHDAASRARKVVAELSDRAAALHDSAASRATDYQDRGSSWLNKARGAVSGAYGSARDSAHSVAGNASDFADSWKNWGSKMLGNARSSAMQARSRARHALGEDDGFGAGSVAGTAVACCAVGAAAMYLFDAQRGHGRRVKIADKTASFVRRTGRSMRSTGQDFANRLRGLTHRMTPGGNGAHQESSALTRSVRSLFSRSVTHPDFLDVTADPDGTVTVSGPIDRTEAESLLASLNTLQGVTRIINRLDVRERMTEREVQNYVDQPTAHM